MSDLGSFSREAMAVVDEQLFSRGAWPWSPGRWFVATIGASILCVALIAIGTFARLFWVHIAAPTYRFLHDVIREIAEGNAWAFIVDNGPHLFQISLAFLGTVFLLGGGMLMAKQGFVALSFVIRSPHFSIFEEMEKARQAELTPMRKLLYWPVIITGVLFIVTIMVTMTVSLWYQIFTGRSLMS